MVVLPRPARRSSLRAFSVALALGGGLAVAGVAAVKAWPSPAALGALAAITMASPGLIVPRVMRSPYRLWNRAARVYAVVARCALMRLCFYTVVAAVALTGSTLRLAPPAGGGTLWQARQTQAARTYESLDGRADTASDSTLSTLWKWASQSPGNAWTIALLPFFGLLAALETGEDEEAAPPGIYTLF